MPQGYRHFQHHEFLYVEDEAPPQAYQARQYVLLKIVLGLQAPSEHFFLKLFYPFVFLPDERGQCARHEEVHPELKEVFLLPP